MFIRMNQEFLTWEKCEHCVNLKYWAPVKKVCALKEVLCWDFPKYKG